MKNAPWLHRLEYGAFRGVSALVALLPHSTARAVGRRLGDLIWRVATERRKTTRVNLRMALPGLPASEHERLARECFRHLGAATCDTLSAMRFDLPALCQRLSFEGWEHLAAAKSSGRGFFVLSAHLGFWEIAAHVAGSYFGPLSVVGRPLDNPFLDRHLMEFRQRFGNLTLSKRGAARGILKTLAGHGVVGILIDQRVRRTEGISLPFFGHPASTSPVLARLALKTRSSVVPIFCFPEAGGRYLFVARPAIEPEGDEKSDVAVAALTRRYLDATEREIRGHPEQWMWMHRRWREEQP